MVHSITYVPGEKSVLMSVLGKNKVVVPLLKQSRVIAPSKLSQLLGQLSVG